MGVAPEAKSFCPLPNPFVNAHILGQGSQLLGFTTRFRYCNLVNSVNRPSNTVTSGSIHSKTNAWTKFVSNTLWPYLLLSQLSKTHSGCQTTLFWFRNGIFQFSALTKNSKPRSAHLLLSSPFPQPPTAVVWRGQLQAQKVKISN